MSPKPAAENGPLELMEEAFCLLRAAPTSALIAYYLGSLPFILGLLFFWSDMARSVFAEQRLFPGSLGLAFGFLWMKLWQAVFARHLHATLCGAPQPRWEPLWLLRTAVIQSLIQPLGLFLLPLAFGIMLPFGWTMAFFANVTVFSGESAGSWATWKRAWRQTLLWPMQNHNLIFILSLFFMFVFLDIYTGVLGIPLLLEKMLGIQSVFSTSPWAAMNSTMTAAVAGLTYLCCGPFTEALYVLRCFYGESLRTGQDLQAELRALAAARPHRRVALTIAAAGLLLGSGFPAATAAPGAGELERPTAASPEAGRTVEPASLDRTIERVIQQREYSWRSPRETAPAARGAGLSWIERMAKKLGEMSKAVGRWIVDVFRALKDLWSKSGVPSPSGSLLAFGVHALLLLLALVLLGLLGWLLYKLWRDRARLVEVSAEALPPAPDLTDESVGAERLPEDGWRQLARELFGRGELRLALRALYLSTLAHLAKRELISLARFKSNRDYERELTRRGHALETVLALFSDNLSVFERVWYGLHDVTPQLFDEFSGNVDRLKGS